MSQNYNKRTNNDESEELISRLSLDCILLSESQRIKFRIYSENDYRYWSETEKVDLATLEMFYNWSKYAYESGITMLEGGHLSDENVFEFIIKKS